MFQTLPQDGQTLGTVVCKKCGARTPVLPTARAVAAWNEGETERRPAPA